MLKGSGLVAFSITWVDVMRIQQYLDKHNGDSTHKTQVVLHQLYNWGNGKFGIIP